MSVPGPARGMLTALDWMGLVTVSATVAVALFLGWGVAPVFGAMFAEFGGELPALTRLALGGWGPTLLALLPCIPAGLALTGERTLGARRALLVGAFALGLAVDALVLWTLYLPVFALAGAVEP